MYNKLDLNLLPELVKKSENKWKKFLQRNRKKIQKMDDVVHDFHFFHSENTDCLSCANCCKTLGPRITQKDVEKLASTLRMKSEKFFDTYLKMDDDGDWVFRSMPCPFLGADNYCSVYEYRPKACREYPHTDRKRFYQIYHLSIKNASTCPIVFKVMEDLSHL